MKKRCSNPHDKDYAHYGGRGITVCSEWGGKRCFAKFLSDMGPKPHAKMSIDRWPNPDGNYEVGNCRWATQSQQLANRRPYSIPIPGRKRKGQPGSISRIDWESVERRIYQDGERVASVAADLGVSQPAISSMMMRRGHQPRRKSSPARQSKKHSFASTDVKLSFREFADKFREDIFQMATEFTKSKIHAEDVCQESMIALSKAYGNFNPSNKGARTWIRQHVWFAFLSWQTQFFRENHLQLSTEIDKSDVLAGSSDYSDVENADAIDRLISGLPAKLRDMAFRLSNGESLESVAASVGQTPDQLNRHLRSHIKKPDYYK